MKIAILGYGVEGKSAYDYLKRKNPKYEIDIFDQKSIDPTVNQVTNLLDINYAPYGAIVRSPSIPPEPIRKKILADKNGSHDFNLTSGTQIFFDKCPAPIIGVTGTKGKGTVSSMIKSILDAAGRTAHLVGNIGTPALDVLSSIKPHDIVVYELSSFQLWDIHRKSPSISVVLTIAPDHLDIHSDFEQYITAKANITAHQTEDDLFVYYANNEHSVAIADKSVAHKVAYPSESGAHIRGEDFYFGEQKICSAAVLNLPGAHNQENALAAISAVYHLVDHQAIEQGLSNFKGLPHRLELVRTLEGISYYDDSFSSATPALEVAVKAFSSPIILIAGGYDRGLDYTELGVFLNSQSNLKKVILIGQTKTKIAQYLPDNLYEFAETLESAVTSARSISAAGDVVLLSPGCASFDMFKDFKDRGEKFQTIVKGLK